MKNIVTRFKKRAQTCNICYNPIEFQGKLDTCHHTYCYDCILRWSEVIITQIENSCPVCKTRFSFISLVPHRRNYRFTRRRNQHVKIKESHQHMDHTHESLAATLRNAEESIHRELRTLLRELYDFYRKRKHRDERSSTFGAFVCRLSLINHFNFSQLEFKIKFALTSGCIIS